MKNTPNASFFSYSWYLDAVAENWIVIVNDDYTSGIALPFIERASVRMIYSPIFLRYIEFLGTTPFEGGINELIHSFFQVIDTSYKEELFKGGKEFVYQQITDFSNHKFGSQAERSLKKAIKNEYKIVNTQDCFPILKSVELELKDKFDGINEKSIETLGVLFEAADKAGVMNVYEVVDKASNSLGGIVCLENESSVLYLKGAVSNEAKSNGAMYLALSTAIEKAKKENKTFDFGGSRMEGVMKFNHNLGGEDVVYYNYSIDNGPLWFKVARRLKKKWSKK